MALFRKSVTEAVSDGVKQVVLLFLGALGLWALKFLGAQPWWLSVFLGAILGGAIGLGVWKSRQVEMASEKDPHAQSGTDLRPWISVEAAISGPFEMRGKEELCLTVDFVIKNYGKLPAADVTNNVQLVAVFGDARPMLSKVTQRLLASSPAPGGFGRIVIPDGSYAERTTMSIALTDVRELWANADKMAEVKSDRDNPLIGLSIVGCVDYKFTFRDGHHQTPYVYDVRCLRSNGRLFFPRLSELPLQPGQISVIESLGGMVSPVPF